MVALSVRTESFRGRGEKTRNQGAGDAEQSRPSSSGGRLEQHLGAVESVDMPPPAAALVPSIPVASRTLGFPTGPRATAEAVTPARINADARGERDVQGGGRAGGRDSGAAPTEHTRAFKGGSSGGASFGSPGSRAVVDEQYHLPTKRTSDARQQVVGGRRARDRKGGGRQRSVAEVGQTVGAEGNSGNLARGGGVVRGNADGVKERPRRVSSQLSFGSSVAEGGGGGAAGGGNRRGGQRGGEVGEIARRARLGTQDNKFRMQAGQSNTLVAVRLRPLLKHDREHVEVAKVLDHRVVVLMDPAKVNQEVDPLRVNRTREKRYAFDYVFDATATQRAVYENTTKFLIQGVVDGYNATVFAYGCTGAGKTYTMIGNGQEGHQGIMVLTLQDLFKQQRRASEVQGRRYSVTVSFLEVYNENIRDLLNDTGEFLDLREDPIKGPTVSGLAEVEARTPEEIMDLLHQGNQSRTQQATRANAASSRSHAVLQVVVESRDKAPGTVATMHIGKLSLVDLAGSERAAATQNRGVRLVEGANINRSLLALGNCINALGERGNKGQFVPYRDSKLTRLLKDSLGGNCRTVMIANISGASSSFEETLNTLKYANRAKNIKTNATRNSLDVNHHISEYVNLIGSLRTEITRLKHQLVRGGRNGGGVGTGAGGDGVGSSRSEAMVFSPSFKASTNSLFAPAEDEQQELRGSHSNGVAGSSERASLLLSASSSPSAKLTNDGGSASGVDAAAGSMMEVVDGAAGSGTSSRNGNDFAMVAGVRDAPVSSPPVSMAAGEAAVVSSPQDRDFVEEVREKIVENFRERMQLRRSLIELEDQNVQNSIEVGKRQLSLVEWHGGRRLPQEAASDALRGLTRHGGWAEAVAEAAEAAAVGGRSDGSIVSPPPPEVRVAWRECEQLCSAISKNNETKRKISRRLRNNGRQAERFKADLDGKITGEDRNQLMRLQYRIGKLELDNMELEQSRIVHESAMRGKDLTIEKLQLQLAVRDRTIAIQQSVLKEHSLDNVGFAGSVGVGITDALDAFLPEGVVVGRADSVGSTPFEDGDHGDVHNGDDQGDGDDGDSGVLIPRCRNGRRGGWGSSSSDSEEDCRQNTAAKMNGGGTKKDGPAGNAVIESGNINTRSTQRRSAPVSATGTAAAAEEDDKEKQEKSRHQKQQQQHQHQPRDRLEQMMETTLGRSTGQQWPKRRPSKTMSRTTRQTTHPPPPQPPSSSSSSLQPKPKYQQIRSRRRRVPSNTAGGGGQLQGDHDDDSIEDGLVVSSIIPDAASCVAPFHGPLPVSLAFGCSSDGLLAVPAGDDAFAAKGSRARDERNSSLNDLAAVRGISVKQQQPLPTDRSPNPQNQPPFDSVAPSSAGFAGNSASVVPVTTWDGASGGDAAGGSGLSNCEGRTGDDLVTRNGPLAVSSSTEVGRTFQHQAQPPHPLKHGSSAYAEASATPAGRVADGPDSMGISGTSVALPWSRRQAPTSSCNAGGAVGAGANRRRLRRKQTRAAAAGGVAGSNWGSDAATTNVAAQGWGERSHGGDDVELRGRVGEDRPPMAHGVGTDAAEMIVVASAVGAGRADEGEQREARFGSLANLKARMGVRYQQQQQQPAEAAAASGGVGVASGERNTQESAGKDRGPQRTTPYQAF
ncbi:unnamed protein product [Ectocarpus sp. 4 AP-2014]